MSLLAVVGTTAQASNVEGNGKCKQEPASVKLRSGAARNFRTRKVEFEQSNESEIGNSKLFEIANS
jgi:hypothetical protein